MANRDFGETICVLCWKVVLSNNLVASVGMILVTKGHRLGYEVAVWTKGPKSFSENDL
jgi:hypothetical protein